jgi:hypothetical protein
MSLVRVSTTSLWALRSQRSSSSKTRTGIGAPSRHARVTADSGAETIPLKLLWFAQKSLTRLVLILDYGHVSASSAFKLQIALFFVISSTCEIICTDELTSALTTEHHRLCTIGTLVTWLHGNVCGCTARGMLASIKFYINTYESWERWATKLREYLLLFQQGRYRC